MTLIATARLLLRPPRKEDADNIVRQLNNFSISKWTACVPYPYSTLDAEDFLRRVAALGAGNCVFAIVPEEVGQLVGVIGCEMRSDGEAEIGYWIAEDHWGKGYGREAARAMTDHALDGLGHDALVASYQVGNTASRRILEGLGFCKTGEGQSYSLARKSETEVIYLGLDRKDRKP